MANKIQQNILDAIDLIAQNRIDKMKVDKTITAIIKKCTSKARGEYRVTYDGGDFYAYSNSNDVYAANQKVYILVPQGDFSKKKIIIDKATVLAIEDEEDNSDFAADLDNFNILGANLLTLKSNAPLGLCSYLKEDYRVLYSYDDKNIDSVFEFNKDAFDKNKENADALLISGAFQTNLPQSHVLQNTGEYAVSATLVYQDVTNTIGTEDGKPIYGEKERTYLLTSKEMNGNPLRYNIPVNQHIVLPIDTENFKYIKNILIYSKGFETENFGSVKVTTSSDGELSAPETAEEKERNFYTNKLKNIADIYNENPFTNISINNLQVCLLETVDATNGDFRINLNFSNQNNIFYDISENNIISVRAKLFEKKVNQTNNAVFQWFKKNNKITASSGNLYSAKAGEGWELLTDQNNTSILQVSAKDNNAEEVKYLCMATYNDITVKQYFSIFNESCSKTIQLSSSRGEEFFFGQNIVPAISCAVTNTKETDESSNDNLKYVWSVKTDTNTQWQITNLLKDSDSEDTTIYSKREDLKTRYNNDYISYYEAYQTLINKEKRTEKEKAKMETLQGQMKTLRDTANNYGLAYDSTKQKTGPFTIDKTYKYNFDNNKFYCNVGQLSSDVKSITISCEVFDEDGKVSYGTKEITLKNQESAYLDFYITIENGDQVFQYDEAGLSPASSSLQEPLEVKPLIAHFFTPQGIEIESNLYNLTWQIPQSSTMLKYAGGALSKNPATGREDLSSDSSLTFTIEDSYNASATNNQFKALISYKSNNREYNYSQYTNFTFAKNGDNGTNGTSYVAKLSLLKGETNISAGEYLPMYCNNTDASAPSDYFSEATLQLKLYNKNEEIESKSVKFSIVPNNNRTTPFSYKKGKISKENYDNRKMHSQIVKGEATYTVDSETGSPKSYSVYSYLPFAYLQTRRTSEYYPHIVKEKTLQYILYDANGANPAYNHNQGICIKILDKNSKDCSNKFTYFWRFKNAAKSTLSFALDDKNSSKAYLYNNYFFNDTDITIIDDMFNYFYTTIVDNNETKQYYKNDINLEEDKNFLKSVLEDATDKQLLLLKTCQIKIGKNDKTLYDLLNTIIKELAVDNSTTYISLFGKTGVISEIKLQTIQTEIKKESNEVSIDNLNEKLANGISSSFINIIPAPLTTGDYNENNIVQCTIKQEGDTKFVIYIPICITLNTHGLASLNAWDGTSVEIDKDKNYVLAPQIGAGTKDEDNAFTGILMGTQKTYGNDSEEIGLFGYSGGRRSIFLDAGTGKATFGVADEESFNRGQVILNPDGNSTIGNWVIGKTTLFNSNNSDDNKNGKMIKSYLKKSEYNKAEENFLEDDSKVTEGSIPYQNSGIILNASNSPYISVKTKPLTTDEGLPESTDNSRIIKGDALEVVLNPNRAEVFSIVRHRPRNNNIVDIDKLVYIDNQGYFVTNGSNKGSVSNEPGAVAAFGQKVANEKYLGLRLSYDPVESDSLEGATILKFFTKAVSKDEAYDSKNQNGRFNPVIISTSTASGQEFSRPLQIYSNDFSVYVNKNTTSINSPGQSTNYLKLSKTSFSVQNDNIYLHSGVGGATLEQKAGSLTLQSDEGDINNTANTNINNTAETGNIINKAKSTTEKKGKIENLAGNLIANQVGNNVKITLDQNLMDFKANDVNYTLAKISGNEGKIKTTTYGIEHTLKSESGSFQLKKNNNSDLFKINSTNGLTLGAPGDSFYMNTSNGSFQIKKNALSTGSDGTTVTLNRTPSYYHLNLSTMGLVGSWGAFTGRPVWDVSPDNNIYKHMSLYSQNDIVSDGSLHLPYGSVHIAKGGTAELKNGSWTHTDGDTGDIVFNDSFTIKYYKNGNNNSPEQIYGTSLKKFLQAYFQWIIDNRYEGAAARNDINNINTLLRSSSTAQTNLQSAIERLDRRISEVASRIPTQATLYVADDIILKVAGSDPDGHLGNVVKLTLT